MNRPARWIRPDRKVESRSNAHRGVRFSVVTSHSDYGPVMPVEADADSTALSIVLPPKPEVPEVPEVPDRATDAAK